MGNEIIVNVIVIGVLLAIVAGIVLYLYKAKKRGETCIGCPYAKSCKSCSCARHKPSDERKRDL